MEKAILIKCSAEVAELIKKMDGVAYAIDAARDVSASADDENIALRLRIMKQCRDSTNEKDIVKKFAKGTYSKSDVLSQVEWMLCKKYLHGSMHHQALTGRDELKYVLTSQGYGYLNFTFVD